MDNGRANMSIFHEILFPKVIQQAIIKVGINQSSRWVQISCAGIECVAQDAERCVDGACVYVYVCVCACVCVCVLVCLLRPFL